jgi:hypothetical protein
LTAGEIERIATLLESPAPARESLGRRWCAVAPGRLFVWAISSDRETIEHEVKQRGGTVTECDLVPVEEES